MPTYEYACRTCGSHLEVVQAFTDDPLSDCPSCGGALRKVFGSIGIAFKGSGFYKTDSRSSAGAVKGSEPSGGDSPSTEKKDERKDAKKDGKKDTKEAAPTSSGDSSKGDSSNKKKAKEPAFSGSGSGASSGSAAKSA